jgi:hypothetical protein
MKNIFSKVWSSLECLADLRQAMFVQMFGQVNNTYFVKFLDELRHEKYMFKCLVELNLITNGDNIRLDGLAACLRLLSIKLSTPKPFFSKMKSFFGIKMGGVGVGVGWWGGVN